MDINQENRSFCTPVTVLDTVAEQLADVDLTLPDYCPDIEKILKCTLKPKIQTKSLSGGQLQVDGYCIVNVLYVESIKKTIRCCEQNVNFSQSFAVKETPDNPIIMIKTKSEYINCRALSPRRLVMHGAFSLYAKVLATAKTEIFCVNEEDNLEAKTENLNCADLKSFCQEQFSVCEDISITDKPSIETILQSDVTANISEAKAVTGKLMINGEINLKMLYLSDVESGETAKIDYILPFNQIIDCDGIDENTENYLSCDIMSYDIRLKNDMLSEKPTIVLDVKLCVTEQGYIVNEECVVEDAYSVKFATRPNFEVLKTVSEIHSVSEPHMEKVTINVGDGKISKVININCDQITEEFINDENGLSVAGKINICMIIINEDNLPVFIERSFDYQHKFSTASDFNSVQNICVKCASLSYRLADDNTVEVRIELKINAQLIYENNVKVIKDVEIMEENPIKPEKCALTLYYAKQGEKLWDIAKSHNTKLDMLIDENSAETAVLDAPQMLLIPRI